MLKKILDFNKQQKGKGLLSDLALAPKDTDFKVFNNKQFKILTPKQMLQRLLIALAQLKTGNTSEKFINEIRKIIYCLYRAKEFTKKVHDNIMNSVKL